MKPSPLLLTFAILLSACNFSLAQDITPPPGYISPTPPPTLGPLFPAQAPNVANGAQIYTDKCAPCHGVTGLGDGEKGKQLPVTVAAIGLAQVARAKAPATWYTTVSQGNIERYMPPFASLNDQERWDVIAYAMSLHSTPAQIAHGQKVFDANCVDCSLTFFMDIKEMSALSDDALVALLKNGSGQVVALKAGLSDEDLYDAAAYLRSLGYASPSALVTATATLTPASAEATPATTETVSAGGTPLATEAAIESTPEPQGSTVTGSVVGANVAGLSVKLRGFDHSQDQNTTPQEVLSLDSTVGADGTFMFSNVEFAENRIFVAEVTYSGVQYQSSLAFVQAGMDTITIPPFTVYETTSDLSAIRFTQVHMFFDISGGMVQAIVVYTFTNSGQTTWLVDSQTDVPFIKVPVDAQNPGYDVTQDSAPLLSTDNGFAMPPSDTAYGFVSFYSLPYTSGMQVNQPFTQAIDGLLVLVPEGVKLKSDALTEGKLQNFNNTNYRQYDGGDLAVNSTVSMKFSGSPAATGASSNAGILIAVGVAGLLLISAGVWLYTRDRRKAGAQDEDDTQAEDKFTSQEDLLDAIIALDDLHRAGKIQDEAYQTRRAELIARLKDLA